MTIDPKVAQALAAAISKLVEQAVAEQLPTMLAVALSERDRVTAERVPKDGLRVLSLAKLAKQYRCGRLMAKRLIASGELPAIERITRGGRVGTFVAVADAERVLAGQR